MKQFLLLMILFGSMNVSGQVPGTIKSLSKISPYRGGPLPDTIRWRLGVSSVMINDIDGDGIPEQVISNDYARSDAYLIVMRLNQDGTPKRNVSYIGYDKGGFGRIYSTSYSNFGKSLTNMGDLDGNGVDDIVVSNPRGNNGKGEFFFLFMNRNGEVDSVRHFIDGRHGLNITIVSDGALGSAVANIGDLDGDGVVDLAVGGDGHNDNRGALWILFMNRDHTVNRVSQIVSEANGFNVVLQPHDRFGSEVVSLGDLDGDGVPDLMVGEMGYNDYRGKIWTLFMNRDGTVKDTLSYEPAVVGLVDSARVLSYGSAIANIGDIDGDSITDVAVSASGYPASNINDGKVWIWMLNRDGSIKSYQTLDMETPALQPYLERGDGFGTSLTSISDFNKDGIPDLCVAALGDDDADPSNASTNSGALYFLYLNGVPVTTSAGDIIKNGTERYFAYPNPAGDQLTIRPRSAGEQIRTIDVLDISGKVVRRYQELRDASATLMVGDLPTGSYFVRITSDEGMGIVQFIKR